MKNELQGKIEVLNQKIQEIISSFVEENGLNPYDLIVELDDSYLYGMIMTPTKYGLFWNLNKSAYQGMKIAFIPGTEYKSSDILRLYGEAIGKEMCLPWRDTVPVK